MIVWHTCMECFHYWVDNEIGSSCPSCGWGSPLLTREQAEEYSNKMYENMKETLLFQLIKDQKIADKNKIWDAVIGTCSR